jgi:hypothetical protein
VPPLARNVPRVIRRVGRRVRSSQGTHSRPQVRHECSGAGGGFLGIRCVGGRPEERRRGADRIAAHGVMANKAARQGVLAFMREAGMLEHKEG